MCSKCLDTGSMESRATPFLRAAYALPVLESKSKPVTGEKRFSGPSMT